MKITHSNTELRRERLSFRRERACHRGSALGKTEQYQTRIGADVVAHL